MTNFIFSSDLVDQIPVGLVVWQLQNPTDATTFALTEANPAARLMLDLMPDRFEPNLTPTATPTPTENLDPFPAFLKIEPPQSYAKVLQTAAPEDFGEVRYRRDNQIEKIYTLKVFPLCPNRVGAILEDVTDRFAVEQALRASEQKLLFYIQQTPLAVIEWDLEFKVVMWNPAAEQIFGYRQAEAIDRLVLDLIIPRDSHAEIQQIWHTLITQKGDVYITSENQRKDGKIVFCEWHSTALVNEDSEVIGVTSLIQDVTAARREEADRQSSAAALSASELRYRRLFEAAQDGVLILDGETGSIIDANPFLSTLLGYSHQELLSKKLWDLGIPSDRTANLAAFQLLQTEGYVRYDNLPLVTQAGQQIEVEFVGSVHLNGIKRVAQCNIRDVSDRKRREADRKKFNLQLELSNRELQDFAFVASHDLQEPLRKIQAFGDRLRLKYANVLSDEGQDYLNRIQNAAKRMQTLIDDLLAFSRITTKAQPFVLVSLADIMREVLSDLEIRIQEAGGRVEVGDLPILEADPMQMRQLLQNLISNALKFHQPGIAPLICIQSQDLSQGGDRYCQITVADNGIGFDEKYLDRIFTVFQRLHGRSEYEGTGVGLAICRKIVERHGGSITATSQPGVGSTFFVVLPLHHK